MSTAVNYEDERARPAPETPLKLVRASEVEPAQRHTDKKRPYAAGLGFARKVRRLSERFLEDVDGAIERDPAATSRLEVVLTSPGLHAIWAHRGLHELWKLPGGRLPARVLATVTRSAPAWRSIPGPASGDASSSTTGWASSSARPRRSATT